MGSLSASRSSKVASRTALKWIDHTPSSVSSKPIHWSTSASAMCSSRCWNRIVPASVTRFTRKWSGYSGTGTRAGLRSPPGELLVHVSTRAAY